jgi:hypothetical protein
MNNHELIEKYTKLVMRRLYKQDVQVFFYVMEDNRALFRNVGFPPYIINNKWDKNKCNITFHSKIFSLSDKLPPHTWNTIVHEVTHYKIGIEQGKRGVKHSISFRNEFKKNLTKVKDLHQDFKKEIGE